MFRKVAEQPDFWSNVKHSYILMEDTGGQPEVMDKLPALTIGPGRYLLFISYQMNSKGEFNQSGSSESTVLEQSTFTLEEMLLSALSSITCSNITNNLMSEEEPSTSICLRSWSPPSLWHT